MREALDRISLLRSAILSAIQKRETFPSFGDDVLQVIKPFLFECFLRAVLLLKVSPAELWAQCSCSIHITITITNFCHRLGTMFCRSVFNIPES